MMTGSEAFLWLVSISVTSFVILLVGWLVFRCMREPIERVRTIQFTFLAIALAVVLGSLPGLPRWYCSRLRLQPEESAGVSPAVGSDSSVTVEPAPAPMAAQRQSSSSPKVVEASRPSPDAGDSVATDATVEQPRAALTPADATGFGQATPARSHGLSANLWTACRWGVTAAFTIALLCYLAKQGIGMLQLHRIMRDAVIAPKPILDIFDDITRPSDRRTRIVASGRVESPMTFGSLRPVVVLPLALLPESETKIRYCLAHEWSHIRRWDILSWRLVNVWQPLLWPQPLYWVLRRALLVNQDYLADWHATRSGDEPSDYAQLLLDFTRHKILMPTEAAWGIGDARSTIFRRIKMIVERSDSLESRCSRRTGLMLILLFTIAASLAGTIRFGAAQVKKDGNGNRDAVEHTPAVPSVDSPYKGPCEMAPHPDGQFLFVAERDARAIAVVDVKIEKVVRSIATPATPTGLCLSPDGQTLYVTCAGPAGTVCAVDLKKWAIRDTIAAGHGTRGPCLSPDGRTLYVCNQFDNDVSVIDLSRKRESTRIPCDREPIDTTITPDGRTVYVSNRLPTDRCDTFDVATRITVIDVDTQATTSIRLLNGTVGVANLCTSPDGRYVFAAARLPRYQMPTTQLERGWMNTNALIVIDAHERRYLNTILLDDVDRGAADPYDVATSVDGATVYVTHAGSHHLSVIDVPGLLEKLNSLPPDRETYKRLVAEGKLPESRASSPSAEDVPNDLAFLVGLRRRVNLPGKGPRGLAVIGDDVFCAMYFSDTIARATGIAQIDTTVVPERNQSIADWPAMSAIPVGPTPVLTRERKGELLFHDASECFQNWLSCATCHPEGRMDSLNWDLLDDGLGNPKNCKSLVVAHATGPSLWLGLHDDLDTAVRQRFQHQLFCVTDREKRDWIAAYLESLEPVPSPHLVDGRLSDKAKVGKALFESTRVGCATCHPAPLYTDRKLHDIGTKGQYDRREQFDTPTLVECWRTFPYLHDGRYLTVQEVLTKGNHGDANDKLSGEEVDALTEFVLSL